MRSRAGGRSAARDGAMSDREPLPIDPLLGEIVATLRQRGALLLQAPPGSGKTTRVPAALLDLLPEGRIVVLEPRRLAARAAAARVAQELGATLGGVVGYQVRGDSRSSRATRLLFVTEGVLVRQLVHDPFLDGVAAVCLDEFHERHLEGDLALAMLQETRSTVRPDLRLCVMSATLDPAPLRAFLGDLAELHADGRLHPVAVVHEARRDQSRLELRVVAAVERALQETSGDVLVFLPGTGEIQRCEQELGNLQRRHGLLVLPLHGRLELQAQQQAIEPQARRKVVLATNVAESSLTIAGVTAVVDTGLVRELRCDRGRGVDVLRLERISLASATQRAGRAGRTGPGVCYRLWSAAEERGLAPFATAEIHRVDLCGPALLVRAFAGRDPAAFGWFEAPAAAALAAADALLGDLGAIDVRRGTLTERGERLLELPLHPRLGAVVLAGRRLGCEVAAATAATLLAEAEQIGRDGNGDLLVVTDALLQAEAQGLPAHRCRELGLHPGQARALLASRDRVLARGRGRQQHDHDMDALARCLLAGFPDRVAVRIPGGRNATMVGGRGIVLPAAADGCDLVVALSLLETGRQSRSPATLVAPLDQGWLDAEGALQTVVDAELEADSGRVVAVRRLCYRDLPLRSSRGGEVPAQQAAALLEPLLRQDPWRWLGAQPEARRLLARIRWLQERMPELALPAFDDAMVAEVAIEQLGGRSDLRVLLDAALSPWLLARLTAPQQRALAQHAPDRIELPSGRAAVVDYAAAAGPTVSARLQEFFGLPAVGALAGGRVPVVLELLAPNHRPVQVTTDLPSFWTNVYPQVRRELGRRYPRHSWPEDPLAANPEARPRRRDRS